MLSDVLQARVREYAPANAIEQENMLAELMQHYVLASLWTSFLRVKLSYWPVPGVVMEETGEGHYCVNHISG